LHDLLGDGGSAGHQVGQADEIAAANIALGASFSGQLAVTGTSGPGVDLTELIEVARDSMSARIYNLAKRPDEDHMTYESHADAKFVEDCVRAMAEGLVESYPDLAEDAVVYMEQSNDESIHQHNAHAERVAEFSQLKREVNGD
jgi:GTP cyclohydrolase-4